MSIAALSWAKRQKTGSASMKAVLLAVADYADENGYAWPSQRRLADDTELNARTVRDALHSLEEKGFLRRVPHYREDGSRGADRIYLTLNPAETASVPPENVSGGVGREFPGAPERISPLTTFEPSSEPSDEPSLIGAKALTGEIIPFAPKAQAKLNVRGTRIPDDWKPTNELIEFGMSQGLSHAKTLNELASFHDHFLAASGPNATKRDWVAAGRNWLRKAANGFGGSRGSAPIGNGTSAGSRFAAMQRAVARVSDQELFPE